MYLDVFYETSFGIVDFATSFANVQDRFEMLHEVIQHWVFLSVASVANWAGVELVSVDVEMFLASGECGELKAALTAPVVQRFVDFSVEKQLFLCVKPETISLLSMRK